MRTRDLHAQDRGKTENNRLIERIGRNMSTRNQRKREEGVALITAVLILIIVATVAVSALKGSEEELRAGGRSRSAMTSFYAAEAGIDYAENRVRPPRDLTAFNFTLSDGTTVQSRKREESAPQDIADEGLGNPPPGYSINIGSGFQNELFNLNVTASRPSTPTSEIEVKMGILTTNAGAY
jgi:type II secretory pathway component PulK